MRWREREWIIFFRWGGAQNKKNIFSCTGGAQNKQFALWVILCVKSTHFLRRAKSFFNGSKDVLSEQKKCTYPYYSIQFDSYGHPTPCLTGCPANSNPTKVTDLTTYVQSHSFRMLQKELESCEKCRGSMMLCYYEPRLNFPLHQLILSSLNGK